MRRRLVLSVCLLGLVAALPIHGDWLVTRDGARVETKGPWKVKGSQVIFTLPNGTLSVLRKSEVDLDASAVATAQSQRPTSSSAQAETKRSEPSVLVLTNKDIRSADDANAERAEAAAQEGGETEGEAPVIMGGAYRREPSRAGSMVA